MNRDVCQFIFDLGREVERMAAKRNTEIAEAIDAGYAMGYQAGQNDAGVVETGEYVTEVIVMPLPDPKAN
jgi:hypothetical protein